MKKKPNIIELTAKSLPAADYRKLIEGTMPFGADILPKRKRDDPEHRMQRDLFMWAALNKYKYTELAFLYAVPNGGQRDTVTAALLKLEGVKPGIFDTGLDCARGVYHGFRMELKCGKNTLSPLQELWLGWYMKNGYYACVVHDDWRLAADEILIYLGYIKR